jgi:2-polyprenyl-3-methyl-5-hydroxy-6-metoxy-1,4-benzoquinol methylase
MSATAVTTKGFIKQVAEAIYGLEARLAARWAYGAHKRLMYAQWYIQPSPEWFDHQIDIYYQFQKDRNSLWCERGVFGSLALKHGNLLELACGDGFNAKNFYSLRSKRVVACDFDPTAIATARLKNSAPNVEYIIADIRSQMPEGSFENVVWDAAIEHFTPEEIAGIMAGIKRRLTPDGILSGYTIVERTDGAKHMRQHEYEFAGMDDLKRFLTPSFRNVKVFQTVFPSRHNLYFWASDSTLPFDAAWPDMVEGRR